MTSKRTRTSFLFFGIAGLIGLACFLFLYNKAFPQASLDISVNHADAGRIAEEYVRSQGFDVTDYKRTTTFAAADLPLMFLQRSLGMEEMIQKMQDDPSRAQWWYGTRFFRPLQKEEFFVGVSTQGDIVAFSRDVEETASGATLPAEEAKQLVEMFVRGTLKKNPDQFQPKDYSELRRPNRTDHVFTLERAETAVYWSEKGESARGVDVLDIIVQGDRIGGFRTSFYVPATFLRHQQQENAFGMLLMVIAGIGFLLLFMTAIVVVLLRFRKRDLRPRVSLTTIGIFTLLSLVSFLVNINQLYVNYNTTEPFATFLMIAVALSLIGIFISAVLLLLFGMTGESLTRALSPQAPDLLETKSSVRERWLSVFYGVAAAFVFLGYVALLYWIAMKHFGLWAPLEPTIAKYMGSRLPFLILITISLGAAMLEELVFRSFAIPFLKKYVGSTVIALLLPAVIWAFLHSTYPVFPLYIRGIELTIAGILLGILFLRYGLFTAIVAHYTVDAVLFSLPLLLSSNWYLRISGVIPLLFIGVFPYMGKLCMRKKRS